MLGPGGVAGNTGENGQRLLRLGSLGHADGDDVLSVFLADDGLLGVSGYSEYSCHRHKRELQNATNFDLNHRLPPVTTPPERRQTGHNSFGP